MSIKNIIMNTAKPVIVPSTKLILRKHYQSNKTLIPVERNQTILILAPHMDDETVGLGGTIVQHKKQGSKVHCVFITNGAKSVSELEAADLTKIRKQEMEKVKKILGLDSVQYMDLPDGGVQSTEDSQQSLVKIINEIKPDIIYCTTFVDAHPDHINTSRLLSDALKRITNQLAKVRLYEINCPFPPEVVNCVVDITDTINKKREAIDVFHSQTIAFDGFIVLNICKTNLLQNQKGIKAVEVFVERTPSEFIRQCDTLAQYDYNYPAIFKQANRAVTLLWAIYKNYSLKKKMYNQSLKHKEQTH